MLVALVLLMAGQAPVRASALNPNPQLFSGRLAQKTTIERIGFAVSSDDECRGLNGDAAPTPAASIIVDAPTTKLLVTNVDPSGNPGLYIVNKARKQRVCIDHFAAVQEQLALPPGTWDFYIVPRSQKETWGFIIRDATRPMTTGSAPVVSVPKGFVPNPWIARPTLAAPTATRPAREFAGPAPASDCGDVSSSPAFLLELSDDFRDKPVELSGNFSFFVGDAESGRWTCVRMPDARSPAGVQLRLSPGKHPVHLAGKGALPKAAWFSVRDRSRKAQQPVDEARLLDVPASLETAFVTELSSKGPRAFMPFVGMDACSNVATAPDFYLRSKGPLPKATLATLGRGTPLLIFGPLGNDGAATRGDGTFSCVTQPGALPLDGVYAGWVAGPSDAEPLAATLRITTESTRREAFTRVGEPKGALTLSERALPNWYPDFQSSDAPTAKPLWLDVPASLVVFLSKETSGWPAGLPLLLLRRPREGAVELTAPGGSVLRVTENDLQLEAPAKLVAPTPQPVSLEGEAVLPYLPPAEAAALTRKRATFQACTDREWARLDPNGVAGKYDLATYRGGQLTKVESLSGHLQVKVDKACGTPGFVAYEDKLTRKAEQAQLAAQKADIAAIMKRLNEVLQR